MEQSDKRVKRAQKRNLAGYDAMKYDYITVRFAPSTTLWEK